MFKKSVTFVFLVLLLSACDNGVWTWQGTTIHIKAPEEPAVGRALFRLVSHLDPEIEPAAHKYESGVWHIRTKNDLRDATHKSLEQHLQSFSAAEPVTAYREDMAYHFDEAGDVELGEKAKTIIDGSPYPFFIADGVIPIMVRSDYRKVAPSSTLQAAMNRSFAVCHLEIPIAGDGVPPGRFARIVNYEVDDSSPFAEMLNAVNNNAALNAAPLAGRILDKKGSPAELSVELLPHPRVEDKLVFNVGKWNTGNQLFAGQASECFEQEKGEQARRIIGQVGFPQLVGRELRLLR